MGGRVAFFKGVCRDDVGDRNWGPTLGSDPEFLNPTPATPDGPLTLGLGVQQTISRVP